MIFQQLTFGQQKMPKSVSGWENLLANVETKARHSLEEALQKGCLENKEKLGT